MLKAKLFRKYYEKVNGNYVLKEVDDCINDFLEENNYEFIDVKFQSYLYDGELNHSALLVYKEC